MEGALLEHPAEPDYPVLEPAKWCCSGLAELGVTGATPAVFRAKSGVPGIECGH